MNWNIHDIKLPFPCTNTIHPFYKWAKNEFPVLTALAEIGEGKVTSGLNPIHFATKLVTSILIAFAVVMELVGVLPD